MLTVVIKSHDELTPEELNHRCIPNNGCGAEWASYLIVKHNGQIVQVESSAMEPEDVSFYRDLRWIGAALKDAYELGISDGFESGLTAHLIV